MSFSSHCVFSLISSFHTFRLPFLVDIIAAEAMAHMGLRRDIERKIEKKREELETKREGQRMLELGIREDNAYIQALLETLKMLPKESGGSQRTLRAGSEVAKARDAIKKAGKPLYIGEILKAIGRPNDKKNRLSLSGSIAHYVRDREIFSRTAPNTYGLIEFESQGSDDGPGEENDHSSVNGAAVS
jgi:hypothetical protein